jgi:hypothetical protein
MIYLLSLSTIVLFLLVIVALWRSGFKHWSLWIIIPFLVFNLGFSWYSISSLLGYPYANTPPSEHQLLHYIVAKPKIYVLAVGKGEDPRFYVFDYDPETAKKLSQAGREMESGQRVMIRENKLNSNGKLEFYNFDIQQNYPKK